MSYTSLTVQGIAFCQIVLNFGCSFTSFCILENAFLCSVSFQSSIHRLIRICSRIIEFETSKNLIFYKIAFSCGPGLNDERNYAKLFFFQAGRNFFFDQEDGFHTKVLASSLNSLFSASIYL